MDAFRYLGLRTAPFEGRPDPSFFFAAGNQDEALAALRYAVHTSKSCAAVIGESGFGKTLIARMLAERVNRRTNVLWLNGLGQPKAQTELSVYEAGALVGVGRLNGRPVESLLNAWVRSTQAWTNPTLLIVDNADSLRDAAWQDLLSLMTREFESGRRVTVALFGLVSLRTQLSTPRLERIRRRLFRMIELQPFNADETARYVAHRLNVAGRESPLFTDAALAAVHAATSGNPALINQLCDNALVEAFGDERQTIDDSDIQSAVRTLVTGLPRPSRSPAKPRALREPSRVPAVVQRVVRRAESALESVDQSALRPLIERVAYAPPPPPDPATQLEILAASLPPLSAIAAPRIALPDPAADDDATPAADNFEGGAPSSSAEPSPAASIAAACDVETLESVPPAGDTMLLGIDSRIRGASERVLSAIAQTRAARTRTPTRGSVSSAAAQ